MNRAACLLGCLLLTPWPGRAQERYNRWEGQSTAAPVPHVSAQQRGEKVLLAKVRRDSINRISQLRQDSLRLLAKAPLEIRLERGIKQRISSGKALPTDIAGYEYIGKSLAYPVAAIRAGTQGIVRVRLTVNADGQVVGTKITETTIPLNAEERTFMLQQARLILRGLRFEPAADITEEEMGVNYRVL